MFGDWRYRYYWQRNRAADYPVTLGISAFSAGMNINNPAALPVREHGNIRYLLGDVRDVERLHRAFESRYHLHAAALKRVESTEYDPIEAVKTNVLEPRTLSLPLWKVPRSSESSPSVRIKRLM